MKIDLKRLTSQKSESTTGSKKMRLSENAASMVFQLFTKNVYSNPIGTVVREITSNCFDSHVEAKQNNPKWKKTPVLIKKSFDKEANTYYISFIDFGVGMSPKRIEEVYMVYFESTKRADNTQIGGFGIGGKTPLAYKRITGQGEGEYDNSFFVITNFNKRKYYYCIFEGAESPEVSLIHEEDTKEGNGTEIRVPVLEKDIETFEREMLKQLYYFEDIIFEGFDKKDVDGNVIITSKATNDYQIVRGKTFWFRGEKYDDKIHVCLGRVAYPIDYDAIDLDYSDYNLPVAIKLEVGDINVTASRESLDYSEATIKVIKEKLEEVKAELIELLKAQYSNVLTLIDYFNVKENFGRLNFPNGESIYIGNVIKKNDVDYSNFKYKDMGNMPDDNVLFRLLFFSKLYGKKETNGYCTDASFKQTYKSLQTSTHLYYVDDEFNRKIIKQAYLKHEHERYYIIQKNDILSDEIPLSEICDVFSVDLTTKVTTNDKPIKFIKGLIKMQKEFFETVRQYATNYDELEIPDEFILERKREKLTAETLKSTIPVKFVERGYRSGYRPKIQDFVRFKGVVVYGSKDDEYALRKASNMFHILFDGEKTADSYSSWNDDGFGKKKGIMFILVSKNNIKYMSYCKNAYHVSNIYWKMFYRKEDFVKKFFNSYGVIEKYNEIEEFYLSETFKRLSTTWSNRIDDIKKYINSLPENSETLSNYRDDLSKFFDIDNVVTTKEQEEFMKKVDNIITLQNKNQKTLCFLNFPYDLNKVDKDFLLILAKLLSL